MELEPLSSEVRHRKMIKGAQAGTGGLELAPAKCKKDTPAGEERSSTLKVFENICEEHRDVHCLGKEHFSELVQWDNILETKHDWSRSILGYEEDPFQFNVAATEDVLPTPSVLKCWGKITNARCHVCLQKSSSLKHILCAVK